MSKNSFNLKDKILASLKSLTDNKGEGIEFSSRDIAKEILKMYPEDCKKKREASTNTSLKTEDDLISQICAEITSQRKYLSDDIEVFTIANNKIRFKLKSPSTKILKEDSADEDDIDIENNDDNDKNYLESELYEKLREYLLRSENIYSKRIDEKKSSNLKGKDGNKWLFPDIVGIKDLSEDWSLETRNCNAHFHEKKFSLYSFEVKKKINRNNVRAYFFQTVSNSSWSNYSYLVATEIEDKALEELRLLAKSYGIGVIILDRKTPLNSKIIIQSPEKEFLNWDIIDRITKENKDFKNYIMSVSNALQTDNIMPKMWDVDKFTID